MRGKFLKELQSLVPWTWDKGCQDNPIGPAGLKDFSQINKLFANKKVTRVTPKRSSDFFKVKEFIQKRNLKQKREAFKVEIRAVLKHQLPRELDEFTRVGKIARIEVQENLGCENYDENAGENHKRMQSWVEECSRVPGKTSTFQEPQHEEQRQDNQEAVKEISEDKNAEHQYNTPNILENICTNVSQQIQELKDDSKSHQKSPSQQNTISQRFSDLDINSEGIRSFQALTLKSKLHNGSTDSSEIQSIKPRFVKRQTSCSQESIRSTTVSTRPRRKCAGKPRDMGDFIAWPVKKKTEQKYSEKINNKFIKKQRKKGSSLTFAILDLLRQQQCVPLSNQHWMETCSKFQLQNPLFFCSDAPEIPLFKTTDGSEPTCEQCVGKYQTSDDTYIEDQISTKTNTDFKFDIQCLLK